MVTRDVPVDLVVAGRVRPAAEQAGRHVHGLSARQCHAINRPRKPRWALALKAGIGTLSRQIEFIGDSLTAGYGNMSTGHDCSSTGGVARNTDVSSGALTARPVDADCQVNAFSGLGMVRNYDGHSAGTGYRMYYDRALLNVGGDVWRDAGWRPRVVVAVLGIDDFSTALEPGEPWTPESLVSEHKAAYHGFLGKLRARYGTSTTIVVSVSEATGDIRRRGSRGRERAERTPRPPAELRRSGARPARVPLALLGP